MTAVIVPVRPVLDSTTVAVQMWWADSTEANSGPTLGIVRGRPAAGLRDLVAEVAGAEPDGALARVAAGTPDTPGDGSARLEQAVTAPSRIAHIARRASGRRARMRQRDC